MDNLTKAVFNIRKNKSAYDLYDPFEFLVLGRIICPDSKDRYYKRELDNYFRQYDFSEHQMYDAIGTFGHNDREFVSYLNCRIAKFYPRKLDACYFDGTNFYFEIDPKSYDDWRRPGPSKEDGKGTPQKKKRDETRFSAASIIDFIKSLKATTVDGEQYFLDGNSQPEVLAAIERKYGVEIDCRQQSISRLEKLFARK